MEIISTLISLAVLYFIASFIFGLLGAGVDAITGGSSSSASNNPFISQTTLNNGKLRVKVRGNPNATGKISYAITLTEKETGYPVQAFNPNFTSGDNSMFQIIVPLEEDFSGMYWTDWVTLFDDFSLDGTSVRCPKQGLNQIVSTISIITTSSQKICAEHKTSFTFNQIERGLLDRVADMPKIRKQMICFGMAMAFSDGTSDKKEAKVIQDWALRKVETEEDNETKSKLKEDLNSEIKKAYQLGKEGKLDLNILTKNFKSIADLGDKWELMEFLRDIMAADGEADQNELEILRNMQNELGIDPEEFNNMMSEVMTKISTVGSKISEDGDRCSIIANLIGIDPSWSIEQKKSHLVKEANRANGMANIASNNSERENANKMLENIAYYRKNCLN